MRRPAPRDSPLARGGMVVGNREAPLIPAAVPRQCKRGRIERLRLFSRTVPEVPGNEV